MIVTLVLCNGLLQCVGLEFQMHGVRGSCADNRSAIVRALREVPVPPGWYPARVKCVVEVPA